MCLACIKGKHSHRNHHGFPPSSVPPVGFFPSCPPAFCGQLVGSSLPLNPWKLKEEVELLLLLVCSQRSSAVFCRGPFVVFFLNSRCNLYINFRKSTVTAGLYFGFVPGQCTPGEVLGRPALWCSHWSICVCDFIKREPWRCELGSQRIP